MIPKWLVMALSALSAGSVALAVFLDAALRDWAPAHPLTTDLISGTITLPVTALLAIFLVDYFVDRDHARRRKPLVDYLLQAIDGAARDLCSTAVHSMMTSRGGRNVPLEQMLVAARVGVGRSYRFDAVAAGDAHLRPPELPAGWDSFPRAEFLPAYAAREWAPSISTVRLVREDADRLVNLVEQLAHERSDAALLLFLSVFKADFVAALPREGDALFQASTDRPLSAAELASLRKPSRTDTYTLWVGMEMTISSMLHLGLVSNADCISGDLAQRIASGTPKADLTDFWLPDPA